MKKTIGGIIYDYRLRRRNSKFTKALQSHIPVVVYQMGKVGSTSVYESLKTAYKGVVMHRHELTNSGDWQAELLLNHIKNNGKVKLITLVREPISRNISAFFQNFEYLTGVNPAKAKYSTEELKHLFLTAPKMDHQVPLTWFSKNLLQPFGIDVLKTPFPKEKGWTVIKQGNIELLIMRAELDDKAKESAVKDFTGITGFALLSSNVSTAKDYAALYTEFKKSVKLPQEYLNLLYNSAEVQHFYTPQEINEARTKWSS